MNFRPYERQHDCLMEIAAVLYKYDAHLTTEGGTPLSIHCHGVGLYLKENPATGYDAESFKSRAKSI